MESDSVGETVESEPMCFLWEVAEVMFQMMTYGGVPTTVEGLEVCKEVLVERGL